MKQKLLETLKQESPYKEWPKDDQERAATILHNLSLMDDVYLSKFKSLLDSFIKTHLNAK